MLPLTLAACRANRTVQAPDAETGRIADVEAEIAPLPEVFRLVGVDAMNAQEREFLPSGAIYAPQKGVLEPEAVGASRN